MTMPELLQLVTEESPKVWLHQRAKDWLRWSEWLQRLEQVEMSKLLASRQAWLEQQALQWTDRGFALLAANMDRLISAIRLPELVEAQVEKFPIERLEEIILSVSGKEFRAITWLGVVLGGAIGLFQSIFLLLVR